MNRLARVLFVLLVSSITPLVGCGSSGDSETERALIDSPLVGTWDRLDTTQQFPWSIMVINVNGTVWTLSTDPCSPFTDDYVIRGEKFTTSNRTANACVLAPTTSTECLFVLSDDDPDEPEYLDFVECNSEDRNSKWRRRK